MRTTVWRCVFYQTLLQWAWSPTHSNNSRGISYIVIVCVNSHSMYKRNFEAHSPKFFALVKQWLLCILSMPVAIVVQHAVRMRRVILSSVVCPAVLYFSTYLVNGTLFEGGKILIIKRKFWFFLQFVCSRIQRDIIKDLYCSCKVPVILVRF
jgi:hypothetical protein